MAKKRFKRKIKNPFSKPIKPLRSLKPFGKVKTGRVDYRGRTKQTIANLEAEIEALKGTLDSARLAVKLKDDSIHRLTFPSWKMGNGVYIEPREMEEGHLRNAISFCARRLITQLSNTVWLGDIHERVSQFNGLLNEAKRRGIRL